MVFQVQLAAALAEFAVDFVPVVQPVNVTVLFDHTPISPTKPM
jgi:hypothetical protein